MDNVEQACESAMFKNEFDLKLSTEKISKSTTCGPI